MALLAVSSSELPFGKKIPSESLKPSGGEVPFIMAEKVLWRASVPISPAVFDAEYGMPSEPETLGLVLFRKL